MPARNARFRALTEDFRYFLDVEGMWPLARAYRQVMKLNGGGRPAEFTRLKAGATVAEKYIRYLAIVMHDSSVLRRYFARGGAADPASLSIDAVMDLIAGPVESHASPEPSAKDHFVTGLDGVVGLFTDFLWGELVRPGTICRDEDDVQTATSMTFISGGHQIVGGRRRLTGEDAIRTAEGHIGVSYDDYLRTAIDIWRVAPWSVAFSMVDGQRVGCSRVLPLRDSVYEAIRSGQRSVFSCSSADILIPSQSVFIESVSERAETEYPMVAKRSAQQIRTLFLQIAQLTNRTDTDSPHQTSQCRILTLAGTPTSEVRVRKFGFRPVGTRMSGSDMELVELDAQKGLFFHLTLGYLRWRLFPRTDS